MAINPSDIPTTWIRETPGGRTLQELQQALQTCDGAIQLSRDTWTYETTLQSLWNGLRTFVTGMGIDRSVSIGTAIRIYFTCVSDNQTAERRVVIKSHTLHLTPDCILTVTKVTQEQAQVRRDWTRWTLTLTFEDDPGSASIDGVVGGLVSLFGVRAEGAVDIVTGISGVILSITDAFGDATNRHIFVSRASAASTFHWVDVGVPTAVLLGRGPITPEWCEYYQPIFATAGGDTVTIPAPPGYVDR